MTALFRLGLTLVALAALGGCPTPEEEHHEEKEEGHGGHGDEVVLGEAALANARLRVVELSLSALDAETTVPARITLDPLREARVSAVTAGTLERILVRPGDKVSANGALATVQSPELGTAIGDHLSATARMDTARARRDRVDTLRTGGFSSTAELAEAEANFTVAAAEAEAAEERLRVFGVAPEKVRLKEGEHFSSRFQVRSPIEGEVLAIDVSLGSSVAPGDPLFHVGNLDEVWLILDVYERSLSQVKVGANVSFTADAYGDEVFTGTVDQISGWLDPQSRTAEVRVVVANPAPEHRLKPNMFAKARLALGGDTTGDGLVIPADAVQDVEGRASAFVEELPGRFAVRAVRTEPLPDGRLRVVSGLVAGDKVVFEGAFTLKSELAKSELGEGHAH
jgi:cobalt-zinc-cadmium efflux system membrane fusion protein